LPYDSDEAVSQAEKVMSIISQESKKASAVLANEGIFQHTRKVYLTILPLHI